VVPSWPICWRGASAVSNNLRTAFSEPVILEYEYLIQRSDVSVLRRTLRVQNG